MPNFFDQLARQEWPYILLLNSVLLILLHRFRPSERRNVWLTLVFAGLSVLGLLIGHAVGLGGFSKGARALDEIFTVLIGMISIRLWGLTFFRLLLPALGVNLPRILEDVVVFVTYIAWGLVRLRYAGVDLSQLVVTSTVLTAVIAFAMQDTLGNILSGIAIQLDDSIDLGQWVKLDDQVSGKVLEIGWRSTLIETRNGETVAVPNAWLMKNRFFVIGKRFPGGQNLWRRWVWFEVDWNQPPSHVIDVVQRAVRNARIEGMAIQPAPQAVLMEAKEGVARYALRYWLSNFAADDPTDSQVRAHVLAGLARHGVPLTPPTHNVLMTKDNDKTANQRHEQEISKRIDALSGVTLFRGFNEGELHQLAEQLRFAPFEAGDVISRQGAVAHWLYLLTTGSVEIWLDWNGPQSLKLGQLQACDFFGEMGLMTGAPRSATVVAASYVECYRLDHAGFESILLARPELAETISAVLAERLERNRQLHPQAQNQPNPPEHAELLARIKHFFGL